MSESQPQPDFELQRERGAAALIERHFPEDKGFVMEMDFEEALGFIYGQLLENDEDPDEILHEFGVIEGGAQNEI